MSEIEEVGDINIVLSAEEPTSHPHAIPEDTPPPRLASTIRFVPFDRLCTLKAFPRFPDCTDITVLLDDIADRDDCLFIFISHCWWRENSSSSKGNKTGHHAVLSSMQVDSADNDLFKLCIEGISLLRTQFTQDFSRCYVWIDFSCLNQDSHTARELIRPTSELGHIIQACDCMFTPLFDDDCDSWSYPEIWRNKYEEYMSYAWRGDDNSYMNRAWCRLEMFYNSVVPLQLSSSTFPSGDDTTANSNNSNNNNAVDDSTPRSVDSVKADPKRHRLLSSFLHQRTEGKRPHFVYGSKEFKDQLQPVVLSPLPISNFESYHPLRGHLSQTDRDMPILTKLVNALLDTYSTILSTDDPLPAAENDVLLCNNQNHGDIYEGDFVDGMMSGRGVFRYANGNVYEGEFKNDKRHGRGVFRFANGDVYEGEFDQGNFRGRGVFKFANGNVYDGNYNFGKWDGKGTFKFVSGNVYEGDFQNDERHGRGTFRYVSGDSYEGEYVDDKRQGKGIFRFANGNVYEGDFFKDCIDGVGTFTYKNGDVYVGEYRDNKKHGRGVLTTRKGKVTKGVWSQGVYTGSGSYCAVM